MKEINHLTRPQTREILDMQGIVVVKKYVEAIRKGGGFREMPTMDSLEAINEALEGVAFAGDARNLVDHPQNEGREVMWPSQCSHFFRLAIARGVILPSDKFADTNPLIPGHEDIQRQIFYDMEDRIDYRNGRVPSLEDYPREVAMGNIALRRTSE